MKVSIEAKSATKAKCFKNTKIKTALVKQAKRVLIRLLGPHQARIRIQIAKARGPPIIKKVRERVGLESPLVVQALLPVGLPAPAAQVLDLAVRAEAETQRVTPERWTPV